MRTGSAFLSSGYGNQPGSTVLNRPISYPVFAVGRDLFWCCHVFLPISFLNQRNIMGEKGWTAKLLKNMEKKLVTHFLGRVKIRLTLRRKGRKELRQRTSAATQLALAPAKQLGEQ